MSMHEYLSCYILEVDTEPPTHERIVACQSRATSILTALEDIKETGAAHPQWERKEFNEADVPCPIDEEAAQDLRRGCQVVLDQNRDGDDAGAPLFEFAVKALWRGQHHRDPNSRFYDAAVRDLGDRRILVVGETCTEDDPQGAGYALCLVLSALNLFPLLGWR